MLSPKEVLKSITAGCEFEEMSSLSKAKYNGSYHLLTPNKNKEYDTFEALLRNMREIAPLKCWRIKD